MQSFEGKNTDVQAAGLVDINNKCSQDPPLQHVTDRQVTTNGTCCTALYTVGISQHSG